MVNPSLFTQYKMPRIHKLFRNEVFAFLRNVTSRKIYQINHTLNNFSKFLFIVELKTLLNPEPFFPESFPVPSVRFPTPALSLFALDPRVAPDRARVPDAARGRPGAAIAARISPSPSPFSLSPLLFFFLSFFPFPIFFYSFLFLSPSFSLFLLPSAAHAPA